MKQLFFIIFCTISINTLSQINKDSLLNQLIPFEERIPNNKELLKKMFSLQTNELDSLDMFLGVSYGPTAQRYFAKYDGSNFSPSYQSLFDHLLESKSKFKELYQFVRMQHEVQWEVRHLTATKDNWEEVKVQMTENKVTPIIINSYDSLMSNYFNRELTFAAVFFIIESIKAEDFIRADYHSIKEVNPEHEYQNVIEHPGLKQAYALNVLNDIDVNNLNLPQGKYSLKLIVENQKVIEVIYLDYLDEGHKLTKNELATVVDNFKLELMFEYSEFVESIIYTIKVDYK